MNLIFLQAAERRKVSLLILALASSHHLPEAPGSKRSGAHSRPQIPSPELSVLLLTCPALLPIAGAPRTGFSRMIGGSTASSISVGLQE